MYQNQKTEGLESVLVRTGFGVKEYPAGRPVLTHPQDGRTRFCLDQMLFSGPDAATGHSLQPSDLNYARLSELVDVYALKTAGELEEGECLLLERDDLEARELHEDARPPSGLYGVYTVLTGVDEIGLAERFASEGRDYLAAKDLLFMDVGGRTVPRFQYELLSAAVNMGLADRGVLVKLADGSLKRSDVRLAAGHLFTEYNRIYRHDPPAGERMPGGMKTRRRGIGTFFNYFLNLPDSNQAGCPTDLDVLLGIALVTNHRPFMKMYDEATGEDSQSAGTFWGALDAFYHARQKERLGRHGEGEIMFKVSQRLSGLKNDKVLYQENLYCEEVEAVRVFPRA